LSLEEFEAMLEKESRSGTESSGKKGVKKERPSS